MSFTLRPLLRTRLPLPRSTPLALALRHQSSSSSPNPFRGGPAPPRLPKEEQEVFEQLQRQSTGAFSTPQVNQSPLSSTSAGAEEDAEASGTRVDMDKGGDELHPNVFRGAKPEFEGEVNPKTGEVGGPKNEPLRWGGKGDWSYNGRVTDF